MTLGAFSLFRMFRHVRPVRFAEVDAARIVYFARYLDFCHDALEAFSACFLADIRTSRWFAG